MTLETSPKPITEQPFDPTVVHFKSLEFIWGKRDGFRDILSQIPSFTKAASELPHSFWEFGGQVACEVNGYDLSVDLEIDGREGITVLDVGLESEIEDFGKASLTLTDPAPDETNTDEEKSSFVFGTDFIEPVADTPTAEAGIIKLREKLRSLIPTPGQ